MLARRNFAETDSSKRVKKVGVQSRLAGLFLCKQAEAVSMQQKNLLTTDGHGAAEPQPK